MGLHLSSPTTVGGDSSVISYRRGPSLCLSAVDRGASARVPAFLLSFPWLCGDCSGGVCSLYHPLSLGLSCSVCPLSVLFVLFPHCGRANCTPIKLKNTHTHTHTRTCSCSYTHRHPHTHTHTHAEGNTYSSPFGVGSVSHGRALVAWCGGGVRGWVGVVFSRDTPRLWGLMWCS